ncbi:MAG: serine O-acetyltransferase [Aureliella sp.]
MQTIRNIRSDIAFTCRGYSLAKVLWAILFYRSIHCVIAFRVCQGLARIRFLAPARLLLQAFIATVYGCYLSPKAMIGPGLHLPHAIGIVIGEGVVASGHLTVYQSVTIGGKMGPAGMSYPTLGEGVTFFPLSAAVGGIYIGSGSQVGAGAVVCKDHHANSVLAGVPARDLRTSPDGCNDDRS